MPCSAASKAVDIGKLVAGVANVLPHTIMIVEILIIQELLAYKAVFGL